MSSAGDSNIGHKSSARLGADPASPGLATPRRNRRGNLSGFSRTCATSRPMTLLVGLLAVRCLVGSALLGLFASGAEADGAVGKITENRNDGTVFVSRGSGCNEDYASELRAAGLEIGVRSMDKLDAVASFVGLPAGPAPDHIVIINGYVIANHVGPSAVRDLLRQRPQIRGIAGIAKCPTPENHSELDATAARSF